MISASLDKETHGGAVTMLALTAQERAALRAIIHRVVEDVQMDKKSYLVRRPRDRDHGRLVRNGVDITELTYQTERVAHEFLREL